MHICPRFWLHETVRVIHFTASAYRKSGGKTPRTPKALRAKSCGSISRPDVMTRSLTAGLGCPGSFVSQGSQCQSAIYTAINPGLWRLGDLATGDPTPQHAVRCTWNDDCRASAAPPEELRRLLQASRFTIANWEDTMAAARTWFTNLVEKAGGNRNTAARFSCA